MEQIPILEDRPFWVALGDFKPYRPDSNKVSEPSRQYIIDFTRPIYTAVTRLGTSVWRTTKALDPYDARR